MNSCDQIVAEELGAQPQNGLGCPPCIVAGVMAVAALGAGGISIYGQSKAQKAAKALQSRQIKADTQQSIIAAQIAEQNATKRKQYLIGGIAVTAAALAAFLIWRRTRS